MIKLVIKNAPSSPLWFATADHGDAYKHPPLCPDQRELAATPSLDPSSREWESFLPNTQLFGCTTDALQYNCLSRIIATLATRLLNIPNMVYCGDFRLVTLPPLTEAAALAFAELNDVFSFVLRFSRSERD